MSEFARVSSELTIQAAMRRSTAEGRVATVLHRGDAWGGAILLKLNFLDGTSQLLTQTRDQDGKPAWLRVKNGERLTEADADTYINRQLSRDPDLWVIEIEDREGRHHFEGRVL